MSVQHTSPMLEITAQAAKKAGAIAPAGGPGSRRQRRASLRRACGILERDTDRRLRRRQEHRERDVRKGASALLAAAGDTRKFVPSKVLMTPHHCLLEHRRRTSDRARPRPVAA